jgi:hypothetical protein
MNGTFCMDHGNMLHGSFLKGEFEKMKNYSHSMNSSNPQVVTSHLQDVM